MRNLKAEMFNRKAAKPGNKADEIIRALALKRGQNVADVGVGGGYFSLRFSRAVEDDGKIYAVDTNRNFLEFLKIESEKKGQYNIETNLAKQNRFPLRKKDIDLVFLRNVYHHIPDRVNYFKDMAASLKEEGRVAIIDYDGRGGFSFHRLFGHYVPKTTIIDEMSKAGYGLCKEFSFLPQQSFLIFSKIQE
ncbi:class I SAM-dependent methyltransferase [Methanolobus bombayensis]|uniref:class I SAM-dependent methyltransferase n=1 Tax=Methanolobus bombayensis TaxID=38023 RepID=UPI001AE42231|nr:methyltransferase domain-containing protein [Methanolobus bombayensis]MBP1908772.1 ubiquinone/menaquinone biosynthesis C-methylase UbiE [Methanolobus bombayensis]